jgi:hypothetical protein
MAQLLIRKLIFCGVAVSALALAGCGIIHKKPAASADEMALVGRPIPPEQAGEILDELGSNFIYGPALGETAVNVGTVVMFPPYALYLVGNALLSLSGYEPVTVSSILPEEEGKEWSEAVDGVFSGPGQVVAAMAGRESRSREVAEAKVRIILESLPEGGAGPVTSEQGATRAFAPK